MEDSRALAADCIVISCCCQCLILQILVFFLLKLPYKLIRKTRDFALKKIRERKRRGKIMVTSMAREFIRKYENDQLVENIGGRSVRLVRDGNNVKCIGGRGHNGDSGRPIDEVERVMEELSRKGEFGFGSFWCKKEEEEESKAREFFPTCLINNQDGFIRYDMIQMVASFNCT